MTQPLRTFVVLKQNLSLVPRTYMAASNHLELQVQGIHYPSLASLGTRHVHV